MGSHNSQSERVFRQGSRNFYSSSLLFPLSVRRDITALYAFVRTADNYVDTLPQEKEKIDQLRACYHRALQGKPCDNSIVSSFVEVVHRCRFDQRWIDAFFKSMYLDLTKKHYHTMQETLEYIYGSAEVIALCILRILGASENLEMHARLYGRALQYINFIRDIEEDNTLERIYLPIDDYHLPDLSRESAHKYPKQFVKFIHDQIDRYYNWLQQGTEGLSQLARRYRYAIGAAGALYNWVAERIARNPFIIFNTRVKPGRITIFRLALGYSIQVILSIK